MDFDKQALKDTIQEYANKWFAYVRFDDANEPPIDLYVEKIIKLVKDANPPPPKKTFRTIPVDEYVANATMLLENVHNQPILVVDQDGRVLMSIG